MKINIVIISAKITIILICDTCYGNVLYYISLLSLLIITHDLTPIIYTLYLPVVRLRWNRVSYAYYDVNLPT